MQGGRWTHNCRKKADQVKFIDLFSERLKVEEEADEKRSQAGKKPMNRVEKQKKKSMIKARQRKKNDEYERIMDKNQKCRKRSVLIKIIL